MADANVIDPADVQFTNAPGSVSGSDVVVHGNAEPSLERHDPETFAGLVTQRAIPILYQQSGQPSGDTVQRIYEKALDTANDYQKSRTLAGEQAQLEMAKQQWGEGPGPTKAALAQPGGLSAGKLTGLSDAQEKDLAAYGEGFYALQRMHGLFDNMVQHTATAGGELKSGFGFLSPVGQATSLEARNYHSYVDFNLVGLAKAIQGDSATGASKDTIQAAMKEALPNDTDNAISGGNKIYNMMDIGYHKLLAMRNSMVGKQDTTNIDNTLVNMQSYMQQPAVQKYNALNSQNQPVVQMGNSGVAQAAINNVNAAANAGVTQMTPTGYVGGYGTAAGGPAQQPDVSPQMAQHAQQTLQAHQLMQNIGQTIGKGIQTGWNWLQPFPTTATGEIAFPGQGQ